MADATYTPKVYRKDGGDSLKVASGGHIDVESGGELRIDGVAITATAAEINAAAGTGVSATELDLLDGAIAGTAVASKALALGATKNVDTLVIADGGLYLGAAAGTQMTRTAAQLNADVTGVAAGYKLARSAAPVALDGANPTSVAHGLTSCVSAVVSLAGSAAPGVSTSTLTVVINGANLDVYGWKPNGAALTELVASAGTETFNWIAIGT